MDESELTARLRGFGLSEKEVATYLTILDHGEAKASTVAEDAGVSKRYVYSVSDELEERGFVEVNDHAVPTTIRARPPEEVIGTLTGALEEMRPDLEARYTAVAETDDEFEVIKSRPTVLKRIRRLLGRARNEVTLSIPHSTFEEVREDLVAATERDVAVLLLLTGVEDASEVEGLAGAASVVRVWSEHGPTMLTVDSASGLTAPNEMLGRTTSDLRAISYTQDQLVAVLVGSFLGNYWPMAEEVYVEEPAELPHSYDGFRHAVLQATLHLEAGTDLEATVEVLPVHETDGERTIEGRVIETRQSLVEPTTSAFAVENTIVVETDEGEVRVGGPGAFVEEFEAERVTLQEAE
jgi:HTH-type transcriptional regulator, sugar sensing transcriptional regulator